MVIHPTIQIAKTFNSIQGWKLEKLSDLNTLKTALLTRNCRASNLEAKNELNLNCELNAEFTQAKETRALGLPCGTMLDKHLDEKNDSKTDSGS